MPRRCGLATYTSHVFDALGARFPEMRVDHYAMNDPGGVYDYPASVTGTLRQDALADYLATAERIEASGAELVWIQHEFGIFGGPAGAHLLALGRAPFHSGRGHAPHRAGAARRRRSAWSWTG